MRLYVNACRAKLIYMYLPNCVFLIDFGVLKNGLRSCSYRIYILRILTLRFDSISGRVVILIDFPSFWAIFGFSRGSQNLVIAYSSSPDFALSISTDFERSHFFRGL